VDYIVRSCVEGVNIGYTGPRSYQEYDNWPSAYDHAEAVEASISKDIAAGTKAGPFSSPPFTSFVGSPMGAFKKKRSTKVRVIHDLSWPPGLSINDHIDINDFHISYMSVDDVTSHIQQLGIGTLLAKLDLEDAFKHIPVRPEDWPLLGSTWTTDRGKEYYHDMVLQFGAHSSPKLLCDLADAYCVIRYIVLHIVKFIWMILLFSVLVVLTYICQSNLDIMCCTCTCQDF